MRTLNTVTKFMVATVVAFTLPGCGDKPPEQTSPTSTESQFAGSHDDDVHITAADVERPHDYAAAVERIITYGDTIRDEIAAERPRRAHRPLDELTFVLEWLPEIARKSGVAKRHWETINVSTQEIRVLFDQVHRQIDNAEQPDFDAVADRFQRAIDTLSNIEGDQAEGEQAESGPAPDGGSDP